MKNSEFTPFRRVYLNFFLLLGLAYLPMLSFRMALKNDALTLSYPPFRFFSEQLRAGHIPWWHYNLQFGLPLHADPGFPFWNPLTWLFAAAGSGLFCYTLLLFTYIMIGGLGMIGLGRWLRLQQGSQLLMGLAYCLSGFFVAHLQHPHYIFAAAFLPFCLRYFLQTLQEPGGRAPLALAISLFFLVNSGYPSFAIGILYFFAILMACSAPRISGRALLRLITAVLVTIVLSLPFLCSFLEFYPWFNRARSSGEGYAHSGGLTPQSLLSLLFPLPSATGSSFFGTDRAWNNLYIGLLPLLFLLCTVPRVRHPLVRPLAIAGTAMLLLSFHGPLKSVLQQFLPLYAKIHSNGGLRVFFILPVITIAAMGFDDLNNVPRANIKKTAKILLVLSATTALVSLFYWQRFPLHNPVQALKTLALPNALLLQSLLATSALTAFLLLPKNGWLPLCLTEIALSFLMVLPYTGLGLHSTAFVQQHASALEETYRYAPYRELPSDKFFKDPAWFAQTPVPMVGNSYPTRLQGGPAPGNFTSLPVTELRIWGDHLRFKVTAQGADSLLIAQRFYPHWQYSVNGQRVRAHRTNDNFTVIPLKSGTSGITARYQPRTVWVCLILSIFAWLAMGAFMLKKN